MIRKRLRRVGIDLNDQRINQSRAGLEGIATIDLSSASDLLWLGLILLLPPSWADVIIATRTPYVKVGDEIRELHKIGGMGNGFIFELESLIFYCIVSAAIELRDEYGPNRPNHVTVYGDDIIVDSTHAVTAVEALTSFGFRINYNKSFWKGPFRESCGNHYHNGKLITPIYIKHFDFTFGAWYHLYNSLVVLGDRLDIDFGKELRKIEHYLRAAGEWNLIPSTYGLRAGIHCEFDAATPKAVRRPRNNGKPWVQGWRIRVYGNRGVPYIVCQQGAYLRRLREMYYKRDEDNGVGEIIAFCLPYAPVSKRRIAVYVPKSFTPPGGYNNNKGDRRFNLRTCDRDSEGFFEDLEISFW